MDSRPREPNSLLQIRWAALGILLLALGLAAVGCSGVRDDESSSTPGSAASHDGGAADPFIGMWDFDFEGPQTAPFSLGMLMIDEPCLYIIRMLQPYVFEFIQGDDRLEKDSYLVPLVAKNLFGLARHPSLKFDHDTSQISYEDHPDGPMYTGDYVRFGTTWRTVSSPEETNQCLSTSIDRVTAISPWAPPGEAPHPRWTAPSWLREQLHIPAVIEDASISDELSDPLVGMWDYDPKAATDPLAGDPLAEPNGQPALSLSIGMLLIDEPCAYIVTGRWSDYASEKGDEWLSVPVPHKYVLALPRTHTRFDRETGELWYKDLGPMATGDYVSFGGSPSIEALPEEVSRCSSTAKIRAAEIAPWTVPDWLRERLEIPDEPNRSRFPRLRAHRSRNVGALSR